MSQESSTSRHKKAGPLVLQMGAVTGAVDDLVHGYEQLVHALPNLTETISNVHADTEQMAKALEVCFCNVDYLYLKDSKIFTCFCNAAPYQELS